MEISWVSLSFFFVTSHSIIPSSKWITRHTLSCTSNNCISVTKRQFEAKNGNVLMGSVASYDRSKKEINKQHEFEDKEMLMWRKNMRHDKHQQTGILHASLFLCLTYAQYFTENMRNGLMTNKTTCNTQFHFYYFTPFPVLCYTKELQLVLKKNILKIQCAERCQAWLGLPTV